MNNHHLDFIYPPNLDKANQHRLANRIFKGEDTNTPEQCECCLKRVGSQTVQTSCMMNPTQFSFMGPGVPLYFLYLRTIIVLLLIMSVLFMGFSIYSNATSSDCGMLSTCIPDAFNIISLVNKTSKLDYLSIQSYLSLAFVVATILFFQYFRLQARKLEQECDQVIDSPSDYAIILRRLPKGSKQSDILSIIQSRKETLTEEQKAQSENLKTIKIVMSYSLRQYNKIKQQNIQQFKTCIKNKTTEQFIPKPLPQLTNTSTIAIVIFQHQQSKNLLIHKPNILQKITQFFCTPCLPLSQYEINGEKISIERAPQPDDICWDNSGITMGGAIGRKMGFGMIGVLILIIGGGAQYGLQLLSKSTSDESVKSMIDVLTSILITVFNAIIMISLVITTEKQRNETLTQYQTMLMVKITIFQFFNAGIFVIGAQIAANYQTFSLNDGICSQITMIMILNSIIPNLMLFFFSYSEIINKVMLFLVQKQFMIATQLQVNQLSLGPQVDIPNKYAYVLKTLWLTSLYSPLVPIVVVISMIGIILHYIIQKMLYTRKYSIPNTISSMVFESAVQLLQYFLIAFAFGQFIVYYYFVHYNLSNMPIDWTITILSTISLSVLNSVLPMQAINEHFFKIQESAHSSLKYSDIQQKFQVTYEMLNPAYKSTRQRNNNKDFISNRKQHENKQSKAVVELSQMFQQTSADNRNSISKQPLLNDFINQTNINEKSTKSPQMSLIKKRTMIDEEPINKVPKGKDAKHVSFNEGKISKQMQEQYKQIQTDTIVKTLFQSTNAANTEEKKKKVKEGPVLTDAELIHGSQIYRNVGKETPKDELVQFFENHVIQGGFKGWIKEKRVRNIQKNNQKPNRFQLIFFNQKKEQSSNQKQEIKPIKKVVSENKFFNFALPQQKPDNQAKQVRYQQFDPKKVGRIQLHNAINQAYIQVLGKSSHMNSKSSLNIDSQGNRKDAQFNDPIKQKKATYDPIHLQGSYKAFLNNNETPKVTGYLNKNVIMNLVGTPFSTFIKEQKQYIPRPSPKSMKKKGRK